MGFSEIIAETARRAATQDDWYVDEGVYILEIRATGAAILELGAPSVFMILPMGPEGYSVNRVMRQAITPTLGGLVAEERGLLWRDCTVRGTFGITPRPSVDTSILPEAPAGGAALLAVSGLSGPGWTRRLIRNYIEKYGELRSKADLAGQVTMIWHDMKFDEHWVIVPETFEIDRTSARRHQYPYTFKFKGIADASDLVFGALVSKSNFFSKLKAILAAVSKALALVVAAINELTEIVGEIAYFVATIDSIVDKIDSIIDAAQNFKDGVTSLFALERAFLIDALQIMQDALNLMEGTPDLPTSTRQTLQMAMDGIDAMAAQRGAFSTSYAEATKSIASAESGAKRTSTEDLDAAAEADPPLSAAELDQTTVRKSDNDLIAAGVFNDGRTFPAYTGFRQYIVRHTDTLQSIAAQVIGDGSRWFDLAIINNLEYPYISSTGAPGTAAPGTVISIPVIGGESTGAVATAESGSEPGEDLLGTDIALQEVADSAPGRPLVDLQIDKRTYRDIKLISGISNLEQAIQMRLWTQQGTMPLSPSYGLPRIIGLNATGAEVQLIQLAITQALNSDSRVKQVSAVRVTQTLDVVEFDIDVIPIGDSSAQQVTASIA